MIKLIKYHFIYLLYVQICWILLTACGTVVGNPKKPKSPSSQEVPQEIPPEQNPVAIELKIPTIDLDLGDTISDDDSLANMLLTSNGTATSTVPSNDFIDDPSILKVWSRRLDVVLKSVNSVSNTVNQALNTDAAEVNGSSLKLKKKGKDHRLSAKIVKLSDQGTLPNYNLDGTTVNYNYEAVICFGDRVASYLRWTKDQKSIELIRDLRARVADTDSEIPFMTHLTISETDQGRLFDLHSSGAWTAHVLVNQGGSYIVEHSQTLKLKDGGLEIKAVADYFPSEAPLKFEGDTYIVGRLIPQDSKNKAGQIHLLTEFLGYHAGFSATTCQNGFDESSPTLWSANLNQPRFCLGRPLGDKYFKSIQQYRKTLASLEGIGILSKKTLAIPSLGDHLSCD